MKTTITLTHKGWFGICPVYFADLDKEDMTFIEPRRPWLEFLFDISELFFSAIHWCMEAVNPDVELWWPITITGELDPTIKLEINEE